MSHLKVLGCVALALTNSKSCQKLDEKSVKCIFVSYSSESKAYKLHNPITGTIIVSRNVVFNENAG